MLELLEPGNSKHWIPTRPIFTWDDWTSWLGRIGNGANWL